MPFSETKPVDKNAEIVEKISQFFNTFDGWRINNSDGKEIIVNCVHPPKITKYDRWKITFQGYNPEENFIDYSTSFNSDGSENQVFVSRGAELSDPDLKGKNVFFQILRKLATDLPENFIYDSTIAHDESKKYFGELTERLTNKQISEKEAKEAVYNSYVIQQRIRAGFTNIKATLKPKGTIFIKSSKNQNNQLNFEVDLSEAKNED